MTSRFYTGGSSSESEEELSNDEQQQPAINIPSKFAKGAVSDSGSEDDEPKKRVVRSTRDKRFEELEKAVQAIKNYIKINDWNSILSEFDKLNKQLAKASQIVAKEGVPKPYLGALVLLEEAVKQTHASGKMKTFNATNAKSYNAMKQKLRKNNKNYEKELEEYLKNRTGSDDEDEVDASGTDSQVLDFNEEPEEDEDEEEEEDEEGEESDNDEEAGQQQQDKKSKWLLKADEKKEEKKDDKKKAKGKGADKQKVKKDKAKKEVEKEAKKASELTEEDIKTKLNAVLAERGKKKTEPIKQVEKLTELFTYAKSTELQLEILTHLVSAQFDLIRVVPPHQSATYWKNTEENLSKMLKLLEDNPSIVLQEAEEPEKEEDSRTLVFEEEEDAEIVEQTSSPVGGNLIAFIGRLDDELFKSLQAIDPHTKEYVQRLQDENVFLDLATRAQEYYERVNKPKHAARIASRRIEHIYYKRELPEKPDDASAPSEDVKDGQVAPVKKTDNKAVLERLVQLVYKYGDERIKTRAMLCHIYFYALHDRFYEARDMMLMSHLQDSIIQTDIPVHILFNRTMAQLGLCAFRANLIKQAHSCLSELYANGRVKELLAQGTSTRQHDKNPEQEKLERKRQLPFHMHINLELLEAVHLISALLLEVPNMAANAFDVKKKIISRTFRRMLDYFDRQVFVGPPENTRDIIITASKCLSKGDWKKCETLLLGLPVWNLVHNAEQVKTMLRRKIQEEGLRTYLFTYSNYYDSMSLEQLSLMFALPKNVIHSIVSKLMISEDLHASWDQPTGSIIMHKVEPSRLQYLALQFSDKVAALVESNERLLDSKTGGYGYKSEQGKEGRYQDKEQGRQQDRKQYKQQGNKKKQGERYQRQQNRRY